MKTHLSFAGTCEEAFGFYKQLFGGTNLVSHTYGETPSSSDVPASWHCKIVHATLTLNGTAISGVDLVPDLYKKPQGFSLLHEVSEAYEAKHLFMSLAEGGAIQMPLQETFWAPLFGVVVDRFGVPWEINCAANE
ncbi:MAG: VOC family protein [Kordiimonadaceae bacterium]|nr:VOC family protein [Kordiimonadaceae bacterium]